VSEPIEIETLYFETNIAVPPGIDPPARTREPKRLKTLGTIDVRASYDTQEVARLSDELRKDHDVAIEYVRLITVMSPGVRCYAVTGRVKFKGRLDILGERLDENGEPIMAMNLKPT
jgi:hypothetical protein